MKQKNYYVVRMLDTHTINYVDTAFQTKEQANEYFNSFKATDRPHTTFAILMIKLVFKNAVDYEIVHNFAFQSNLFNYTETHYDRAKYFLKNKLAKGTLQEIAKQYQYYFTIEKQRIL